MKPAYVGVLALFVATIVTASQSLFIIDETQQGLVLQLGQPIGEAKGPGLHFKIPFIQQVQVFEKRILSVDPQPKQMVVASSNDNTSGQMPTTNSDANDGIGIISGEPIVVDVFARYLIKDPLKFLKSLRNLNAANQRIENMVNDSTRAVLGQTTLSELLSAERNVVMERIKYTVNEKVQSDDLGIEIIDVRIVRADLTDELRQSTVQRMISDLRKRATETRAKGDELALEIRSTAEKEREILLAEANKEAEILRGEGDNTAIQIYASSYNKDPEFFAFWRSMQAYDASIANEQTNLVVSPDSGFFKFFNPQD